MALYNLIYRSESSSEHKMLNDLDDIILANKIHEKAAEKLRLLISEAFTNALTHGNKLDPDKSIEISIEIKDSEVIADIKDEGTGGLKQISERKEPELLSEGGRGIDLIEYYADNLECRENKNGNLILTIRLSLFETKNENTTI